LGSYEDIFKNKIPLIKQTLDTLVEDKQIISLPQELNSTVGSSYTNCIVGG
jgi:hypothetical protein